MIFPDGGMPEIDHEATVVTRDGYLPWVHRIMLQSLFDHQVVLEIGAGNVALDDPCIIRMDVKYSPHVDLVADAHALPFLPGSIDYIFSLAVFEHLRNPFIAAQSIFDTLKDGGFIYHECNFVFAYHGYPHHYFNASLQGMEQIFADFVPLRKGVATYQMPSFALDMVLRTYLSATRAAEFPHGQRIVELCNSLLNEDLKAYDIYFTEQEALRVAAGTYFAGYKASKPEATLLPKPVIDARVSSSELQQLFPDINDITQTKNLFVWAKREGRHKQPAIRDALEHFSRFNKRGSDAAWNRDVIHSLPMIEAEFSAIGSDPKLSMAANSERARARAAQGQQPGARSRTLLKGGVSAFKALAYRLLRRLRQPAR